MALTLNHLFAVIMLSGAFSLVSAMLFVVMDAVDVAFTEAAVGAGVSTVLMLATMALPVRVQKEKKRPIILPLVEALGFNLTWFAILVAVNLQTAWLSPPVPLSAYFLKGVVPEWDLKDIYIGMMQFMILQIIGLVIIIIFPKIVLWLPSMLYGQ